jgi:tripartite-type tricarboxylate transporter receptor subunit TctC
VAGRSRFFTWPFLVENRTGAATNIATEAVVRAALDGYILLLITSANAINAAMFKLNFDFVRDIAPVAGLLDAEARSGA